MDIDLTLLAAVAAGLMVIGIGYNWMVTQINHRLWDHPLTGFLVVGGTLITLGGFAIVVGWGPALVALACFAASGLPMVAGSVHRWMGRAAEDTAGIEREIRDLLGREGYDD